MLSAGERPPEELMRPEVFEMILTLDELLIE
jgi:ATP sulfurylase